MSEAIQGGSIEPLASLRLRPVLGRQILSENHALPLVGRAEHVDYQLGSSLVRRHASQLIKHQQMLIGELIPQTQ